MSARFRSRRRYALRMANAATSERDRASTLYQRRRCPSGAAPRRAGSVGEAGCRGHLLERGVIAGDEDQLAARVRTREEPGRAEAGRLSVRRLSRTAPPSCGVSPTPSARRPPRPRSARRRRRPHRRPTRRRPRWPLTAKGRPLNHTRVANSPRKCRSSLSAPTRRPSRPRIDGTSTAQKGSSPYRRTSQGGGSVQSSPGASGTQR